MQARSATCNFTHGCPDALASASAVQQGRQPEPDNLRGLGIDPAEFRKISRHY